MGRLIPVSDGVEVEITEWSAEGAPIIFLAGMTHTMRCMAPLAAHFADQFHCIGITRRGFGESSEGELDYSMDRLVQDLEEVCRALGIDSAIWVGHSFGCAEIEQLNQRSPSIVKAAVFLDGAYDHTGDADFLKDFNMPGPRPPSESDLKNMSALSACISRTMGVTLPEREIEIMFPFTAEGSFQAQIHGLDAAAHCMAGFKKPDWSALKQPVLGIFLKPNEWPVYAPGVLYEDPEAQKATARFFDAMMERKEAQILEFAQSVPHALIARPEYSNHYLHLSHEWLVVHHMRELLATLD